MKTERNSTYLINKCENLHVALSFFSKGNEETPAKVRRTIFLSQLDFWDWELEELIFSFKNFEERSKSWTGKPWEVCSILQKNNINLNHKTFTDFEYWANNKNYKISSNYYSTEVVVIPLDELNKTINKYNNLLSLCEKELENNNLLKYKKELIRGNTN